jgi:hypothetical protein
MEQGLRITARSRNSRREIRQQEKACSSEAHSEPLRHSLHHNKPTRQPATGNQERFNRSR